MKNKTLLIFPLYAQGFIPLSTESYLKEISQYFSETIVTTNYRGYIDLPYTFRSYKNEGYDFGQFYKVLKSIDLNQYNRIALVNDSNSLVGKFDKIFNWGNKSKLDIWGLTDSQQRHPQVKDIHSYHVQSHFLVFEKRALSLLPAFFNKIEFEKKFMKESNVELRSKIIVNCEYGLTYFMQQYNLKVGARYSIKNWKPMKNKFLNMHVTYWEELINDGYPLIKNKLLRGEWDNIGQDSIPNPKNKWKYMVL